MNDKRSSPATSFEDRRTAQDPGPPTETAKNAARLRWVQLWIGVGMALAVSLLVTSISTYFAVSRSVVAEHLRSDVHSQAAMIEDRARQGGVQTNAQLLTVLDQSIEKNSGRLAWVRVQNCEGDTIAAAGAADAPTFSKEDIRMHFRSRQPLFKSIDGPGGAMLVETLPFILPDGPLRPIAIHSGDGPRGSIEIAEFLGSANVALGAVRTHPFINASAALLLLFALLIIGSRFGSYMRGKELEHQVDIARSVQRDLLPSPEFDLDDFEVAGDYVPVAGISGDFFDTFAIPGGRVGFVIGDVAGKGVPAAVLMGVLHGAVRSSNWMQSAWHHLRSHRRHQQSSLPAHGSQSLRHDVLVVL
jgi:hypothetical protein